MFNIALCTYGVNFPKQKGMCVWNRFFFMSEFINFYEQHNIGSSSTTLQSTFLIDRLGSYLTAMSCVVFILPLLGHSYSFPCYLLINLIVSKSNSALQQFGRGSREDENESLVQISFIQLYTQTYIC